MTQTSRAVMTCLPLLAGVLGQAHGLKVVVGGSTAATNGKTIILPNLPLDSSPDLMILVRGFIDHEAAHIRHTDFDLLQQANATALEQRLVNIFEDWRVEERQSRLFPGCRNNLQALIRKQFLDSPLSDPDPFVVLNWILLTVRHWSVPEVQTLVDAKAALIDQNWPGLRPQLEVILQQVQAHCPDTQSCLDYARQVARVLRQTLHQMQQKPRSKANKATRALDSLLSAADDDLPEDFGASLQRQITQQAEKSGGCSMARIGHKDSVPLSPTQQHDVQRATIGLKTRLHGLLQATRQDHIIPARWGRLDPKRLALSVTGDPKIYRRSGAKSATNTAVHILLDSSGSMNSVMEMAMTCCTAVAQAITGPGVSVGLTTFPAIPTLDQQATVMPLIRHGERVHDIPSVAARGTTPLAEAILWCLQTMAPLSHSRKIILILTDGQPDDRAHTEQAIATGHKMGVEFYGLGLEVADIKTLLPNHSRVITDLQDLPKALFGLLGGALLHQGGAS